MSIKNIFQEIFGKEIESGKKISLPIDGKDLYLSFFYKKYKDSESLFIKKTEGDEELNIGVIHNSLNDKKLPGKENYFSELRYTEQLLMLEKGYLMLSNFLKRVRNIHSKTPFSNFCREVEMKNERR